MTVSELSDDDESDEEEADLTPLSAEERATRLATLVAPLDLSTWGSDNATPAVSASAPPPLVDDTIDSIPLRPRSPKLTSEKYDGASSDSGSSVGDDEEMKERDDMAENADEDDEDGPTIVEEEVDMGGEMDEFLKFATETLGLTQEQYSKILGERRSRGGELVYWIPVSDFHVDRFNFYSVRTAYSSTEKGVIDSIHLFFKVSTCRCSYS